MFSGLPTLPVLAVLLSTPALAAKYFTITVVDEETGRGVPLVELRTVNNVRYYTDSNGVVAFYEPGLMGREMFFHVSSHGYEYPEDGFGYRGQKLKVAEGGSAVLRIKRLNIAERLYRVTGGGIYRDSVLAEHAVPIKEPLLNGLVFGQDSVVTTIYRGKIYWFWGDTSWPGYPLGNFQVAGATSRLPSDGGLPPDVGVNLTYFVDDRGFAKQMAPIPGEGPTWIDGLVTLRDEDGSERMFAVYSKVRQDMTAKERGLLEFDDAEQQFKKIAEFDLKAPIQPGGHPFRHRVDGVDYIYYARPFPVIRVRADRDQLTNLANYEAFTCLKEGSSADNPELDRDEGGALRWSWKHNAPPLTPREQEALIKADRMKPNEARFRLYDVATGRPVVAHGASVYWNEYRRRWLMILLEIGGTSMLGEIWLAEADTPLGPWLYATKIVTHDRYSFYNPKHHPMFDQDGGRVVYFEGTYSSTFSGNPDHTPRYDYNQIMYRLDLSDPRVILPVPVYPLGTSADPGRFGTKNRLRPSELDREPAFLALDRPTPDCVAVYEREGDGTYALELGSVPSAEIDETGRPVFYGLPAEWKEPPATTALLYEFAHADGRRRTCSIGAPGSLVGYRRAEHPLCRVWRNPRMTAIPAEPSSQP